MSFLRDYEIVTKNNEVPETFHLYSSLVAISSIISSRVWLDLGLFTIRPNLYVVLTGEPGVKKTTAMSVTKRLLRVLGNKVPLSAECQTKEALVKEMAANSRICKVGVGQVPKNFSPLSTERDQFAYCPMTVCVTELSQFVGAGQSHMIDFLTTVYDEETYTLGTKNKGIDVMPMPYLTLLACTVPDWITAQLKSDVISGGFCRRAIFVYEKATDKRVPFPEITEEMEAAWDRVVAYAKKLLNVKGPFTWGPGAREFYDEWYCSLKRPDDPIMQGWFNSVQIQMLKIAMLISLSEDTERVLKVCDMKVSLALLATVEDNIPKVFKGVGRNVLFGTANKVVELLEMAPSNRMPTREVMKMMFKDVNPQEFQNVLKQLTSTNQVKLSIHKNNMGKPTKYYELVKKK